MTPEQAREAFDYDPETGVLRWRLRSARCIRIGDVAGFVRPDGYVVVVYKKTIYPCHRIAWAIATGAWPTGQIDHINGDRSDNRILNLRNVTAHMNMQNQRTAHRSNLSSGILGVHFFKKTKRWRATIWANGKNNYLGYYGTAAEAEAAYLGAKAKLHPGYVPAAARNSHPGQKKKAA
jgi:hypothetical protein